MERRNQEEEEEDRLSALPEVVIHQIFSFLDMKDVARTSILSNRWRYSWISTPTLKFNLYYWLKDCSFPKFSKQWSQKIESFHDFIDRVLILGARSSSANSIFLFDVQSFDIHFNPTRILRWVNAALERRVQHLCLDLPVDIPFKLPDRVFTSNIETIDLSITELVATVRLPNSMCTAATLIHLRLHTLIFPDGDANGELILSCPVLKTLMISCCDVDHLNVLDISTPLLESLSFYSLHTKKNKHCKVMTCTPNLRSFSLRHDQSDSYFMVDYVLENFPSLVSASIGIWLGSTYGSYEQSSQCLMKILPSISNVQTLELSGDSIKILTDSPKLLEGLPHGFHNLKHVIVGDGSKSPSGQALLKFLKDFSHMETLVWTRRSYSSPAHKEDKWAANLAFQSTISCLKTFEIHNFKGTVFELKFLAWLLERAISLKEIIISPAGSFVSDKKAIAKKLLSLLPASSNVSISFLNRAQNHLI